MNTFFDNFMVKTSIITNLEQHSELMTCTKLAVLPNVSHTADEAHIWSLYFDGSKYKEGVGAECVLIDPAGNKTLIACRLEFECTNDMVEYEEIMQGLRKELDLKIHNLMVFDN
jgi:hypothetical protein